MRQRLGVIAGLATAVGLAGCGQGVATQPASLPTVASAIILDGGALRIDPTAAVRPRIAAHQAEFDLAHAANVGGGGPANSVIFGLVTLRTGAAGTPTFGRTPAWVLFFTPEGRFNCPNERVASPSPRPASSGKDALLVNADTGAAAVYLSRGIGCDSAALAAVRAGGHRRLRRRLRGFARGSRSAGLRGSLVGWLSADTAAGLASASAVAKAAMHRLRLFGVLIGPPLRRLVPGRRTQWAARARVLDAPHHPRLIGSVQRLDDDQQGAISHVVDRGLVGRLARPIHQRSRAIPRCADRRIGAGVAGRARRRHEVLSAAAATLTRRTGPDCGRRLRSRSWLSLVRRGVGLGARCRPTASRARQGRKAGPDDQVPEHHAALDLPGPRTVP